MPSYDHPLRDICRELDVSQSQLARAFGRSPQFLNGIIRGGQRIPEDFARWLAQALRINLNWLIAGQGPMFQPPGGPPVLAEEQGTYQQEANERLLVQLAHQMGDAGRPFIEAVARRRLREAGERQNHQPKADEPSQ